MATNVTPRPPGAAGGGRCGQAQVSPTLSSSSVDGPDYRDGDVGTVGDSNRRAKRRGRSRHNPRRTRLRNARGGRSPSSTDTAGTGARPAGQHNGWHALLATIEYILDSPGRTERARQLLCPVLVATVLIVVSVTIVVSAAPSWLLGALGLATASAGVVGRQAS